MPDELRDGGPVSWGEIVVVDVTGTTVTLGSTQGNKDGTETKSVAQGDLATGMGNLSFILFPKDLGKGDSLPLRAIINDTLTRSYAGANREVNMLSFSSSTFGTNMTNRFYFDRMTGITCELWIKAVIQQGDYATTTSSSMKLTETNMWQRTGICGSYHLRPTYLPQLHLATGVLSRSPRRPCRNRCMRSLAPSPLRLSGSRIACVLRFSS